MHRVKPQRHPKMSNRFQVLGMINHVMSMTKQSTNRDQHFDLLEKTQILNVILQEVVQYENSLIMDLDVD